MESLLIRVQPEPLDLMEIITASAGPGDEDCSDRHEYGSCSTDPFALASAYNPPDEPETVTLASVYTDTEKPSDDDCMTEPPADD